MNHRHHRGRAHQGAEKHRFRVREIRHSAKSVQRELMTSRGKHAVPGHRQVHAVSDQVKDVRHRLILEHRKVAVLVRVRPVLRPQGKESRLLLGGSRHGTHARVYRESVLQAELREDPQRGNQDRQERVREPVPLRRHPQPRSDGEESGNGKTGSGVHRFRTVIRLPWRVRIREDDEDRHGDPADGDPEQHHRLQPIASEQRLAEQGRVKRYAEMIRGAVRFERRDHGAFGRRMTAENDSRQEQVRKETERVRGHDRFRYRKGMSVGRPVQQAANACENNWRERSVQIMKSPVIRAFSLDTREETDIV